MVTMAGTPKFPNVIDPDKCLLEDFEIIAFERAEDADLYSYWHDQFRGKSLGDPLGREPARPKQSSKDRTSRAATAPHNGPRPKPVAASAVRHAQEGAAAPMAAPATSQRVAIRARAIEGTSQPTRSPSKSSKRPKPAIVAGTPEPLTSTPVAAQASKIKRSIVQATTVPEDYVPRTGPTEPGNGLSIINSHHYRTMPSGKVMAKYKLTKFYNKLRGRQMRRNLVLDRQKAKRLNEVMSKCQLNTWLAYTSLQALHLPGENPNQLSTITINNNPRLITIPQSQMQKPGLAIANVNTNGSGGGGSSSSGGGGSKKKKKQPNAQQQAAAAAQALAANNRGPPMHFMYLDPSDIVTYSNRICPQQITEYRKRSHLLPSTASSKRSSAASYDVFEIMDVLANSAKTNVSITRNANKPAPAGCSIYSHSTNYNTRGIVSTQLHLQAISYLESVGKLYAEERTRLAQEAERLREEPPLESQIRKYIKIDHSYSSSANSSHSNLCQEPTTPEFLMVYSDSYDLSEDVIEQLEQDIKSMVQPNNADDGHSDSMLHTEATMVQ